MKINEVITDPYMLGEGCVYRDGFVFTFGQSQPAVFDRIVIRKPERARANETRMGYSYRSLEEHIALINEHNIEKALIFCDDLRFLLQCPSLKDVDIFPSYDAKENFDYSVLYEMPELRSVNCGTKYSDGGRYQTTIDYSKITGIEELSMVGDGHIGFETIPTLRNIWISGNKKIRSFAGLSCSPVLQDVTFLQCGIQNLDGIENHREIKSLTLFHNYSLTDISELAQVADSLTELCIDACSKIKDFSVLEYLENLEFLQLDGNNTLPNLEFLRRMKKLKVFTFTMNVADGDLRNCMQLPYASCRNRRQYNLKDKDLPKNLPTVGEDI